MCLAKTVGKLTYDDWEADTRLSFSCILLHLILTATSLIMVSLPILQMRKLNLQAVNP